MVVARLETDNPEDRSAPPDDRLRCDSFPVVRREYSNSTPNEAMALEDEDRPMAFRITITREAESQLRALSVREQRILQSAIQA